MRQVTWVYKSIDGVAGRRARTVGEGILLPPREVRLRACGAGRHGGGLAGAGVYARGLVSFVSNLINGFVLDGSSG